MVLSITLNLFSGNNSREKQINNVCIGFIFYGKSHLKELAILVITVISNITNRNF